MFENQKFTVSGKEYQRGEKIAKGSYGQVFAALGPVDEPPRVIKERLIEEQEEPQYVEKRINKEITRANYLNNNLQCEGPIKIGNCFGFLMRKIEGETLAQTIDNLFDRKIKYKVRDFLVILNNLAKKILEIHAAGYVHLDLKPLNIMHNPKDHSITIIDYGTTKQLKQHPRSKDPRGTINFMPIELWDFDYQLGGYHISPKVDSYAYGIIMRLFCGDTLLKNTPIANFSPAFLRKLCDTYANLFENMQFDVRTKSTLSFLMKSLTRYEAEARLELTDAQKKIEKLINFLDKNPDFNQDLFDYEKNTLTDRTEHTQPSLSPSNMP